MTALPPISPTHSALAASDDTYFTFGIDVTQTFSTLALADMPADFQTMDGLTCSVERSLTGAGDDVYNLSVSIVNGSTILAAADVAGTLMDLGDVTGTADVVVGPTAFPYVNTGASKALWDGANLRIRQTYTRNMGGDGLAIRVDHVVLGGTYTPVPIPVDTPTLTAGLVGPTTAELTSTAVGDAATYEFQRDGVTVQNTSSQVFNDTGLAPGTTHIYRVRGVNASGVGPWSNEVTVTTIPWAEFSLTSNAATVDPADPRTLRVRARVTSGTGTLRAKVHEVGTEQTYSGALTTTFQTLEFTVLLAVTDYAALELHVAGDVEHGAELQVSFAELEVPGQAVTAIALGGVASAASGSSASHLSTNVSIDGEAQAAADASASVSRLRQVSGQGAALSAADGSLDRRRGLDASAGSATDADGTLGVIEGLSGAAVAVSGASAALSLAGPPIERLSGDVSVASGALGSLGVRRALDSKATATSHAESEIAIRRELSGTGTAASGSDSRLDRTRPLDGTGAGASTAGAELGVARPGAVPLSGDARTASRSGADVHRIRGLGGAGPSVSEAEATIIVVAPPSEGLNGQATAASRASALLQVRRAIGGDGASSSLAVGGMGRVRGLSADARAASGAHLFSELTESRAIEMRVRALDFRVPIRSLDLRIDSRVAEQHVEGLDLQVAARRGAEPFAGPTSQDSVEMRIRIFGLRVPVRSMGLLASTRVAEQRVDDLDLRVAVRTADLPARMTVTEGV